MEKNDQLFMQLIYMFHTSAMQGLGKIADPTGQVNRNLEYVSQTIDLMEMLKVKTKGNISEDIEKMLDGMLSELKLNYVDEKGKPEEKDEIIKTRRKGIRARGTNQMAYVRSIRAEDLTFGIGPAGTGKTYLAVAAGVEALETDQVRRRTQVNRPTSSRSVTSIFA